MRMLSGSIETSGCGGTVSDSSSSSVEEDAAEKDEAEEVSLLPEGLLLLPPCIASRVSCSRKSLQVCTQYEYGRTKFSTVVIYPLGHR